jgi:hypothetical protein
VSVASSALGGVIFEKDFTQAEQNAKSDLSGMDFWTGDPVGSWGKISIDPLPADALDSPKTALTFYTNSTNPAPGDGSKFAPLTTIKTPGFGASDKTKVATYKLRFMVPGIEGKYRADLHFGGNWGSNGTILVLDTNNLNAMEHDTPTKLAEYSTKAWQDLQVDFDFAAKTYTVTFNGVKVGNAIPWNDPKLNSLESMDILPGLMAVSKDLTPVFYVEKIVISGN